MPTDDKAARKARAERLRQQIDTLVSTGEEQDKKPAQGSESPREFIHRKMKDLQASPNLKGRKES
jgi:hypothetical protein